MAFKPANANGGGNGGSFEGMNFPTPKSGPRKARVSLIVDLGIQEREDFEDPGTKELRPQKPCQQVAVFADLVNDVVDYGGEIGEAQYRLMLNKSFGGTVQGINFAASPPKDAKGNMIEGKPWGWHPANVLTKLSKAIGKPELVTEMDAEQLLNGAFMADVEITEKESTKADKDGNPIVYKYVNIKGIAKVAPVEEEDEAGNVTEKPAVVGKLRQDARCVTFDNAKAEDIKFIRSGLIKQIKLAQNYAGSQMQKAIEAFEASKGGSKAAEDVPADEEEEAPAKAEKPKAAATKPKANKPKPNFDDMDDGIPF